MKRAGSSLSVLFVLATMLCLPYGPGTFIDLVSEARAQGSNVAPIQGKALIVFVRAFSSDATSVDYRQASFFKLKGGESEPEAIGTLSVKTKLGFQVDPGKHLFMVLGENADFMAAEVLPDRIYHVLVLARIGNRGAIFSLKAIDRQTGDVKEFDELFRLAIWISNAPTALNWAAANMRTVKSKQTEYYRLWTQKPDSEKSSLQPHLGIRSGP